MKSLSYRQWGTLQFVGDEGITVEWARKAHQGTLFSLALRGYLTSSKGLIKLTNLGQIAVLEYRDAKASERKQEDDPSDRVQRLLRLSRMALSRTGRGSTEAA